MSKLPPNGEESYVMPPYCVPFSASTHTSCNASAFSPAIPRIRHSTLLRLLLNFHTHIRRRYCVFSSTSTHTSCYCAFSCTTTHASCYAAVRSLALPRIRHDDDDDDDDDADDDDDDDDELVKNNCHEKHPMELKRNWKNIRKWSW